MAGVDCDVKCTMAKSNITLRKVTKENFRAVAKLSVADDQKNFVANNAFSMAEASFEEEAWFRAIYAGDTPVGFAMLYEDYEKCEYGLWRFMIDKNHQGQGFGKAALQLLIDRVKALPNATEMDLHVVPENEGAVRLYKEFGFVATGKVEWGEDQYKLDFAKR